MQLYVGKFYFKYKTLFLLEHRQIRIYSIYYHDLRNIT